MKKWRLNIPLATEPVQISSGHTITLDVNGELGERLKSKTGNSEMDCLFLIY
jgi:hypothetical protein